MEASNGVSMNSPANIAADKPAGPIGLELLHKKTGSAASLRRFGQLVKETADGNLLPDYQLAYHTEGDQAVFTLR